MKTALIEGQSGQIEVATRPATSDVWAALCHPHPLYGGSMHDQVLDRVAQAHGEADVNCVLFNFRGVGATDGPHDHGVGEVDDLKTILEWLRDAHTPREIWLAGYSWGSYVAWRVAAADPDIKRLTLVAPIVDSFEYGGDVAAATQIVVGSEDHFVDVQSIERWAKPRYQIEVLDGADHFFGGCLETLGRTIVAGLKG